MSKKQRDVWFSVLLVVISGFVFFALGVGVAWKWGFPSGKVKLERPTYVEGDTTTIASCNGKINLNTATKEELMQIPGIGETTAKNILNYREQIGSFTFVEQLLDVGGIGEKKLDDWSLYLYVEEGATNAMSTPTFTSETVVTSTTSASTSRFSSTSTTVRSLHSTTKVVTTTTVATTSPSKVTSAVVTTSVSTAATTVSVTADTTTSKSSTTTWSGVLNLNTATAEELMQIKGIGEKTAAAIVAYREEIGGFTSLEQLMDIKGIGEKKFAAWKQYFTLED